MQKKQVSIEDLLVDLLKLINTLVDRVNKTDERILELAQNQKAIVEILNEKKA